MSENIASSIYFKIVDHDGVSGFGVVLDVKLEVSPNGVKQAVVEVDKNTARKLAKNLNEVTYMKVKE